MNNRESAFALMCLALLLMHETSDHPNLSLAWGILSMVWGFTAMVRLVRETIKDLKS